jgi:putative sterol carrier protein
MAVKFLSEEWTMEVKTRIQASDATKKAAQGQNVTIQQVITDVPEQGEVKYYFKLVDGNPELGLGEIENPDATVRQTYETATALNKGDLTAQGAFMQGKLRIEGQLMKLLQLQGFFQALPQAVKDLDVEY